MTTVEKPARKPAVVNSWVETSEQARDSMNAADALTFVWDVLDEQSRTVEQIELIERLRPEQCLFLKAWGIDGTRLSTDEVAHLHKLRLTGNINITELPTGAQRERVKEARKEFLRFLEPKDSLHVSVAKIDRGVFPKPENVIQTTLLCAEYGASPRAAVIQSPAMLFVGNGKNRHNLLLISERTGAKPKQLLEDVPSVLHNYANAEAVVEFLEHKGIEHILRTAPEMLVWNPEHIEERFNQFESAGIKISILAQQAPRILLERPANSIKKLRMVRYALGRMDLWDDAADEIMEKILESPRHVLGINLRRIKDAIRLVSQHSSLEDYASFAEAATARRGKERKQIDPIKAAIRILRDTHPDQLKEMATDDKMLLCRARAFRNSKTRAAYHRAASGQHHFRK